jgi:hypothetical protein
MNNLLLHPLCTLFPRLGAAEFDALADDIAAYGLREPIVLHEGMILDGGNRYEACMAAGVDPRFVEFSGPSPVSFVLSANLHRRHLSAGQQAAIVASAQDWAVAHPAHRVSSDKEGCSTAPLSEPLSTVAGRAAQSGASERTQQLADKVAKADPELARQVAHGEITLPKAVEQVTGKNPNARTPKRDESEPARTENGDEAEINTTLLKDLEAADKQVRDLTATVKSLEADDRAAEIIQLQERCLGLEGVNRQLNTTLNEAKKDAQYWRNRFMELGALVGEKNPAKVKAAVVAAIKAAEGVV